MNTMKLICPIILTTLVSPALAEGNRQLDAHEHGVSELNIAIDGNTIAIELHAPGADIVGFEHAAESQKDRAAIDTAVATLARPLDLFTLPAEAECSVMQANAALKSDEAHEEHQDGHDGHDDHAEEHHDDDTGHTEFHAEYVLTCANPEAITEINFAFFEQFENARELEVQIVSASGAQAFEVERDGPKLDLRGMF